MGWQRLTGIAVEATLVLGAAAILAGALLGQPILLGFVETGSMQPTLDSGDGFVAVPQAIAGPVDEGDVVVFRAEEVNGGKLTTHRVVDETDRGYVTRGDANPFTDQANGEPPVKKAQVVAVALQYDGHVVSVPQLGTAVTGLQSLLTSVQRRLADLLGTRAVLGTQGLAYLLLGATVLLYVVDVVRNGGERRRERDRSRENGVDPRLWIAGFGLVIVLGATVAMVAPAGAQEYGVVSAEFDSPGPRVIPTGESETTTYPVGNGGVLPVVTYFEPASEGVAVDPDRMRIAPRTSANATVTLTAPPETGYYRRYVVEHRYLAVLPGEVIATLYRVHPWAPLVAVDVVLFVAFVAVGSPLVGRGRVRNRSRTRGNVSTRLRGRLRSTGSPAGPPQNRSETPNHDSSE
ncbi:MAG: S26 family signal peptidase [archaeon]